MREILFRGKRDRYGREWVYGSLIQTGKFCCILEPENSDRYDYPYLDADLGTIDGQAIPIDPLTIGQYTGLNDKNGNKIFEGDILKSDLCAELLLVIFNEGCGAFQVLFNDGYSEGFLEHYSDINHLQIIGNFHDNPELLNSHYEKDGIVIEYHYDEYLKGE